MTVAPLGGATTVSRWLIHTVCCGGSPAKSAPAPSSSSVFPNSEASVRATSPPSTSAISWAP